MKKETWRLLRKVLRKIADNIPVILSIADNLIKEISDEIDGERIKPIIKECKPETERSVSTDSAPGSAPCLDQR